MAVRELAARSGSWQFLESLQWCGIKIPEQQRARSEHLLLSRPSSNRGPF